MKHPIMKNILDLFETSRSWNSNRDSCPQNVTKSESAPLEPAILQTISLKQISALLHAFLFLNYQP